MLTSTTARRESLDAPVWKDAGRSFRVYSSAYEARPLLEKEWTTGVAKRVAKRIAENEGGEKGRVFYLGRKESGAHAERVPLAVAAWHLPPDDAPGEPLELLELDVAQLVRHQRSSWVVPFASTLMHALRTTAGKNQIGRPKDRLAWVADQLNVAQRAKKEWGLRPIKASAQPEHNHAKHYLRRIET